MVKQQIGKGRRRQETQKIWPNFDYEKYLEKRPMQLKSV